MRPELGFFLFLLAFIICAAFVLSPPNPARQKTPEELEQESALLRARGRQFDAQAEHDAASLRAELARAELEDTRKLLKGRDGARHA